MEKTTFEINTLLVKDMTIGEIGDMAEKIRKGGGAKKCGIDKDLASAVLFAAQIVRKYRFTSAGLLLTYENLHAVVDATNREFIHIHRLNNYTYSVMVDFYDWLDDRKLLNMNARRYFKKIERIYADYQSAHRGRIDQHSYTTVQDHVRLSFDLVRPLIEPLEFTIRDYLIFHKAAMVASGQKDDIEMLSKIQVVLMFCAALRSTRRSFFGNISSERGVDLTPAFAYADISGMTRNFVWMMEQLGIKFTRDKDGDMVPLGTDFDKSVSVNAQWKRIADVVTDSELMDKTAFEAMAMNPVVKDEYDKRVSAFELNKAIGELRQQENVRSL